MVSFIASLSLWLAALLGVFGLFGSIQFHLKAVAAWFLFALALELIWRLFPFELLNPDGLQLLLCLLGSICILFALFKRASPYLERLLLVCALGFLCFHFYIAVSLTFAYHKAVQVVAFQHHTMMFLKDRSDFMSGCEQLRWRCFKAPTAKELPSVVPYAYAKTAFEQAQKKIQSPDWATPNTFFFWSWHEKWLFQQKPSWPLVMSYMKDETGHTLIFDAQSLQASTKTSYTIYHSFTALFSLAWAVFFCIMSLTYLRRMRHVQAL
jgi:hypothetical protein